MTDPAKPPEPSPEVTELVTKVNSLMAELATEKAARVRLEKVNSIQKTWAEFKDDGKLDLPTVEWMIANYKPKAPSSGKTNADPAPAPTGGIRMINTPNGLVPSDKVSQDVLTVLKGQAQPGDAV